MKQILKRLLVLALAIALTASIVPAASAAEVVLETSNEGILGLKVSYDGGAWRATEDGYRGGTFSIQEKTNFGYKYTPIPGKLMLKNDTSEAAVLSFDYELLLQNGGAVSINGVSVRSADHFELSMSPWETVEIDVISSDTQAGVNGTGIQLENVSFAVSEKINVTFAKPTNGFYTIGGVPVSAATEYEVYFGTTFHAVATPATGYTFLGWFSSRNGGCLSTESEADLRPTSDCTIYPYFYNQNSLQFMVGSETFQTLNAANSYASEHDHAPIVFVAGDAPLGEGTYTISRGNTLVIPCDSAGTVYTTDPDPVEDVPKYETANGTPHTYPYRTLTLGAGAKLVIEGSLCLAGKQNAAMPCIGATSGPFGHIQLNADSEIIVNNGGKLYCWGYITGPGTVTARTGATVYEPFQVMDFRGGNAILNMMNDEDRVFPISQYYVQNIESMLTLEYGAKELVRTVTNAGGAITPATVPFIDRDGESSLFQMKNGCTFTKYYNVAEDRVVYTVNGDCSIDTITMTFFGGQLDGLTINSALYTLPLNGNFDVEVERGTLTIKQDMYVQPGAKISIDEDAELCLPDVPDPNDPTQTKPVMVTIYDSSNWGGYCGPNNQTICPIRYTPSGTKENNNIRTAPSDASTLPDATLDINGQVTLDGGYLLTTGPGANVTSSEGTGKIMFNVDAPAPSVTHQATQGANSQTTAAEIPVTSVKLNNGDGTYTETYVENDAEHQAQAGDPFCFSKDDEGHLTSFSAPDYDVTFYAMGTELPELAASINSVKGAVLPATVDVCPTGNYHFAGWSETAIDGEATSVTLLPGGDEKYQPDHDVQLHAVYYREDPDFVKVTSATDFDGEYLIVYEGGAVAFDATGNTSAVLIKKNNTISVEISNGRISHETNNYEALKAATVQIHHAENNPGQYTIRSHGNNGAYIGNTSDGKSTNVNPTTQYRNTIAVDNGVATIHFVTNTTGVESTNYAFKFRAGNYNTFKYYTATTSEYHMPALYQLNQKRYVTTINCPNNHQVNVQSVTTAPTCTKGGWTTYTCRDCGYTWIDNLVEPLEHEYSFQIIQPTADEGGWTTYTCTRCGDTYNADYTAPRGHDWSLNFFANGAQITVNQTYNSQTGGGLPVQKPQSDETNLIPYVAGYTFVGWAKSEITANPEPSTTPTIYLGTYIPAVEGECLYAVYARAVPEQEQNNGDYVKVAAGDPIREEGEYLFVCENAEMAFDTNVPTISEGNAARVTILTDQTANRIAWTQALDDGDVTIRHAFGIGADNAYTIQIADGKYIGNTGSTAGINNGKVYKNLISVYATTENEGTENEVEKTYVSVINVKEQSNDKEFKLGYNGKFSFYALSNDQARPISLYYKEGTGSVLYYTTRPAACQHQNAYNNNPVITAPTCTVCGKITYTCPDCGYSWTVDDPSYPNPAGHDYVATQTLAEDTADRIGYKTHTCSRCGDTYKDEYYGINYTVTLIDRGTTVGTPQINSYTGAALPTVSDVPFGYEFAGWSEVTIDPESTSAETHKGLYQPTHDITLYATFAFREASTQQPRDYQRVTDASKFLSGGKMLIVCESCPNGPYVFNASADPIDAKGNYGFGISIDNGIIGYNSNFEAYEVTISPIIGTEGLYTLRLPNDGLYIGNTGNSNGINQNTKPNYRMSVTIDNDGNALIQNVDGKQQLRFMYSSLAQSDRFRFYKETGSGVYNVALYYREGTEFTVWYTTNPSEHVHDYETFFEQAATCTAAGERLEVCQCGDQITTVLPALGHDYQATTTTLPTCTEAGSVTYTCTRCSDSYTETIAALGHIDEDGDGECDVCFEPMSAETALQFASATLVLNGKIDVRYTAVVPEGYTNPRVVFVGPNGTMNVTDYTRDGENYVFTYTGINPQCMGDNVSATLYATKNGVEESVTQANYSVKQYCVNQLGLTGNNAISSDLRMLLSDMLAYGAAAQNYMSYNTDALVNANTDLTNEQLTPSTFSAVSGKDASFEGEADANTYWISAGLTLTNSVAMTFRFYTTSPGDLTVCIGLQNFEADDFVSLGNGVYAVSYTGVSAEEFGSTVRAAFERDGEEIGSSLTYSVNAYVQSKQNDSNANLAALVKALYNYGASAAAYAEATAD